MADGRSARARCRGFNPRLLVALIWGTLLLAVGMVLATPRPAEAIPSFARQTGQPCGACHTDFPALTPFGRRFKLGGYTLGGSPQFRATLFPTSEEDKSKPWWPPIATMAIVGFTHTQAPLPPPTQPFSSNNNTVVDPFSFFWGGAITANNNPTVQDVWNTTPAWGFPFAASTLAPTPSAGTVIDGAFGAHVVSAGGYLWINDMFYVEASAYHTLGFNTLNHLGADPFDAPERFDV